MLSCDGRDMMQERHEELLDALVYQQTVQVERGKSLRNVALWWLIRLCLRLSRDQMHY